MPIITLYQVWSRCLPFEEHEPVLRGTRTSWRGAVALKDQALEEWYRLAEATRRRNELAYQKDLPVERVPQAHVSIKEVVQELEP